MPGPEEEGGATHYNCKCTLDEFSTTEVPEPGDTPAGMPIDPLTGFPIGLLPIGILPLIPGIGFSQALLGKYRLTKMSKRR